MVCPLSIIFYRKILLLNVLKEIKYQNFLAFKMAFCRCTISLLRKHLFVHMCAHIQPLALDPMYLKFHCKVYLPVLLYSFLILTPWGQRTSIHVT